MVVAATVVGAGGISKTHLKGIQQNPRTDLVGVCDIDEGAAEAAADSFNTNAFTNYEEVLKDVDCIHICTPVQTHHEIAKTALEAGVAVLLEKPATTTVDEIDDLIQISNEENVQAGVVHTHLSGRLTRKVKDMIDEGDLGWIEGVDVIYTGHSSPNEENRGDWVFDLPGGEYEEGIPHPIYTGLGLAGFPESVDDIDTQTTLSQDYEQGFTYDASQVQYTSEGGTLCNIKILSSAPKQRTVIVHGSEKSVIIDKVNMTFQVIDRNYAASSVSKARKSIDTSLANVGGLVRGVKFILSSKLDDSWEGKADRRAHYAIFDQFAEAVETGGEPAHSLEQAKWTIQIMEEIRETADGIIAPQLA